MVFSRVALMAALMAESWAFDSVARLAGNWECSMAGIWVAMKAVKLGGRLVPWLVSRLVCAWDVRSVEMSVSLLAACWAAHLGTTTGNLSAAAKGSPWADQTVGKWETLMA